MTSESRSHLSIDVGGTKVRIVVYSDDLIPQEDNLLSTSDIFHQEGEADLKRLFTGVKAILTTQKFDKFGLSLNCAMHQNRIVYSSLMGGEVPTDLGELSSQFFDFQRFKAQNDVYAMAQAENLYGIGKQHPTFLFINLGTGMRDVFVYQNQIMFGSKSMAGEISQEQVWVEELRRYVKSLELSGGRGVAFLAQQLLGKSLTSKEAFEHDEDTVINVFIKYLVRHLQNASYFYNPEKIVLAGSLTLSAHKWLDKVKRLYKEDQYPFLLADDIFISEVKDPASLGAILFE